MEYIPPKRGEPVVNDDKSFTLRTQTFLENLASASSGSNSNYVVANAAITPATKTKITYDEKGLVTAGADATTSDIAEGSRLYFTDERVQDYLNVEGYINEVSIATANGFAGTSDGLYPEETITLSTDVTGILQGDGTAMSAVTISDYLNYASGTLSGTGEVNPANSTDSTMYLALLDSATGKQQVKSNALATFNGTTGHITSKMILNAGGTVAGSAPKYYTAGSLLSTAVAGADEYDGIGKYQTFNTTMGRQVEQIFNQYKVGTNQTGITAEQSFFYDGSNNNYIPLLPSSNHLIDMDLNWNVVGSGVQTASVTITFYFIADSSPNVSGGRLSYDGSPLAGMQVSPVAPANNRISADLSLGGAASWQLTFSALAHSTNHRGRVSIILITPSNANQSLRVTIQRTAGAATLTTSANTTWRCMVIPPNTGTYA